MKKSVIHIFIGTKAQYIKTAPLIRYLDRQGIPYNFVDSGQHAEFSVALRRELGLRQPDVFLRKGKDVATVLQVSIWVVRQLCRIIFRPRWIVEHLFRSSNGVCVVHGDTPSTLLAVLFAKRAGLTIAHIEAGLRSYNYFHPFPEEMIRVVTMRMADLLFAPSEFAYKNLCRMGLEGKCVHLETNTNLEAVRYSLSREARIELPPTPYVLATVHRVETILRRAKLEAVLDIVQSAARQRKVVFVLHPATKVQLQKFNLGPKLDNQNIRCLDLIAHSDFVHIIKGADFVLTDGGSIQEECYYLGVPCLLLRRCTERDEGLGRNVVLSNFDPEQIVSFLEHYGRYRRPPLRLDKSTSKVIYENIREFLQEPPSCTGSELISHK